MRRRAAAADRQTATEQPLQPFRLEHVGGRALGMVAVAVEQQHAVALRGKREVMQYYHGGTAGACRRADLAHGLLLVAQIEMLQRFVEQQQACVLRPQLREARALALAAGQRCVRLQRLRRKIGPLEAGGASIVMEHQELRTRLESLEVQTRDLDGAIEKAAAAKGAKTAFDRELSRSDVPASQRHLIARHAADAIPELAKELKAQLVVMGAVSRTGIKRLLISNTAERILDALPCDVLVMKPVHFGARVPKTRRGVQFIATPMGT